MRGLRNLSVSPCAGTLAHSSFEPAERTEIESQKTASEHKHVSVRPNTVSCQPWAAILHLVRSLRCCEHAQYSQLAAISFDRERISVVSKTRILGLRRCVTFQDDNLEVRLFGIGRRSGQLSGFAPFRGRYRRCAGVWSSFDIDHR